MPEKRYLCFHRNSERVETGGVIFKPLKETVNLFSLNLQVDTLYKANSCQRPVYVKDNGSKILLDTGIKKCPYKVTMKNQNLKSS